MFGQVLSILNRFSLAAKEEDARRTEKLSEYFTKRHYQDLHFHFVPQLLCIPNPCRHSFGPKVGLPDLVKDFKFFVDSGGAPPRPQTPNLRGGAAPPHTPS